MKKHNIFSNIAAHAATVRALAAVAAIALAGNLQVKALPESHFAKSSMLASGKWVKIAIPTSGMYELTAQELAQMGFSNPEAVRVYGSGGFPISEKLDGSSYDDLVEVPCARYAGKICFYACGPVKFATTSSTSVPLHYARTINTYSTAGYYFLTEGTGTAATVETASQQRLGTNARATSLDYYYHEQELSSLSQSGRDLLGEDITTERKIDIAYALPGLSKDSVITVNTTVAANATAACLVTTTINGDSVKYLLGASRIYAPSSIYVYYNTASPTGSVTPTTYKPQGIITIGLNIPNGRITAAKLDNFTITYTHDNAISSCANGQMRLGFNSVSTADAMLLDASVKDYIVWNIDNPAKPVRYNTTRIDSTGQYGFSPIASSQWQQYIAFNPQDTLLKISSYENVENQNLHAMATPNMLIITTPALHEQAQRIATLHEQEDGLKVAVVDQGKIFNEFSSGTPDAMAYRLMCKMFYDRDKSTFKHLLLMGAGSYDNRGLSQKRSDCMLLTYESSNSNDEDYAVVSDDFFGFLDDNSGSSLSNDALRIGVGRYPSATVNEAETDVDKLIEYVSKPDYGAWRNNFLVSADMGDNGLHMFQAQGSFDLLEDLAPGMNGDIAFVAEYPLDNDPGLVEADQKSHNSVQAFGNALIKGQYFATYVGHAGPTSLSKKSMWKPINVNNTSYTHFPILTIAGCDVARYDGNSRGIAELMFHKRDGGAIALLASTRSVYSEGNDKLNNAFISGFFTFLSSKKMGTLGEAYMQAKNAIGNENSYNKLSFFLLGDPAIAINYPKPLFKITKVNAYNAESSFVNIYPQCQLTVEAQAMMPDGQTLDTSFTGDATLTVYDNRRQYTKVTQRINRQNVTRTIMYPREELAQVHGRIENGIFKGQVILPRTTQSIYQKGTITVYAHKDGTSEMINGYFDNFEIKPINTAHLITDTVAPSITAMYFNNASATQQGDDMVAPSSTLHIEVDDDYAVNTQSQTIYSNMTLILDGGKASYSTINNYAVATDGGKHVSIQFPMQDMEAGRHTLRYTVTDAAGNMASKEITFTVGNATAVELTASESTVTDKVEFDINSTLNQLPTVNLTVTDATGNIVWQNNGITQFPVTWDLKDNSGKRVPAGLYKYYGSYTTGDISNYGGTAIGELVVLEPQLSHKAE